MRITTLFVLAALALGSHAAPANFKRAPALSISIAAPESVESVSDVKVQATVSNTGAEDAWILKAGSVLDNSPTASFLVTKGADVARFSGIKVSLQTASLPEAAYVKIPAGDSVSVEHDVAALYDFETLGVGSFKFSPKTILQAVTGSSAPTSISDLSEVDTSSNNVEVKIASDVAKRSLEVESEGSSLQKRARVVCSSSSKSSKVSASYTEGKQLAAAARDYINNNGRSSLFTAYFGSGSTSRPASVFNAVANESGSRSLNCDDTLGYCDPGVIAYTLTATTNVYYCDPFYSEVSAANLCAGVTVADRDIAGGTTLHELTHALSGTDDYGYGVSFDKNLARTNPTNAANNADNYNVFATEVYAATRC